MKVRLFLIMLLTALTAEAEAQSFLKKLGNEVGKAVKKEIVNQLTGKDNKQNNNQGNNNNQNYNQRPANTDALPKLSPEQQREQELHFKKLEAERAAEEAREKRQKALQAVVDNGDNIVRDNSLDYIDEYGINHGGGIVIDSIVWAPVNCGYHATDYPYGKLYQWGRIHGQGYGPPYDEHADTTYRDKTTATFKPGGEKLTVAEARKPENKNVHYVDSEWTKFNWTRNNMFLWMVEPTEAQYNDPNFVFVTRKNVANDPCPKGWRVPDWNEMRKLIKNHSLETKDKDGTPGVWVSGNNEYSHQVQRIFLSKGGSRDSRGTVNGRGKWGAYWTATHHGSELMVGRILIDEGAESNEFGDPRDGHSVRCIRE